MQNNDGARNSFYDIPEWVQNLDDLSDYLELTPSMFNVLKTLWVKLGDRHPGTDPLREAKKRVYYSNRLLVNEYEALEWSTEVKTNLVTREELRQMIKNGKDVTHVDVSGITDMSDLFKNQINFNQDISGWDVSNVTDMSYMFYNADSFNQDISNWDTSGVINMKNMFIYAASFNQPIGNWDVSNVTKMDGMFMHALTFNQPIGDWDIGSVTKMECMFYDAQAFNQPIENWNVSNVISMYAMFNNAISFNQNISRWDTSSVENMSQMFFKTKAFNKLLTWTNIPNKIEYMFYGNDWYCIYSNFGYHQKKLYKWNNIFFYGEFVGDWDTLKRVSEKDGKPTMLKVGNSLEKAIKTKTPKEKL